MTTKEMLRFMKSKGYPLTLLAEHAEVEYYRAYRHLAKGKSLSYEDKAKLWRFALHQPAMIEEMIGRAKREGKRRAKG